MVSYESCKTSGSLMTRKALVHRLSVSNFSWLLIIHVKSLLLIPAGIAPSTTLSMVIVVISFQKSVKYRLGTKFIDWLDKDSIKYIMFVTFLQCIIISLCRQHSVRLIPNVGRATVLSMLSLLRWAGSPLRLDMFSHVMLIDISFCCTSLLLTSGRGVSAQPLLEFPFDGQSPVGSESLAEVDFSLVWGMVSFSSYTLRGVLPSLFFFAVLTSFYFIPFLTFSLARPLLRFNYERISIPDTVLLWFRVCFFSQLSLLPTSSFLFPGSAV
jgi:hypothetical protein